MKHHSRELSVAGVLALLLVAMAILAPFADAQRLGCIEKENEHDP